MKLFCKNTFPPHTFTHNVFDKTTEIDYGYYEPINIIKSIQDLKNLNDFIKIAFLEITYGEYDNERVIKFVRSILDHVKNIYTTIGRLNSSSNELSEVLFNDSMVSLKHLIDVTNNTISLYRSSFNIDIAIKQPLTLTTRDNTITENYFMYVLTSSDISKIDSHVGLAKQLMDQISRLIDLTIGEIQLVNRLLKFKTIYNLS